MPALEEVRSDVIFDAKRRKNWMMEMFEIDKKM